MISVIAPNKIEVSSKKELFLAGPIQGAYDWQQKITADLKNYDVVIANPRRKVIDKSFDHDEQVEWETEYLNRADMIIFYLAAETEKIKGRSYAQTTRFELGEWCARSQNKKILVCIEDEFTGKRYIEKRIKEDYEDVVLCSSYKELIEYIKFYI
jgi:hypothetical protein